MSASNQTPTVLMGIGLLAAAGIAVFMWRSFSEAQDQQKTLQQELTALRDDLNQARAERDQAHARAAEARSAKPSSRPHRTGQPDLPEGKAALEPPEAPPAPTRPKPEPLSNTLVHEGTSFRQTEEGPVATLEFKPSGTDPLEQIIISLRVPRQSDVRIIGFTPHGNMKLDDPTYKIGPDGKFALLHGTPKSLGTLRVDVAVSEPTLALLKGSCGIGELELDVIAPGK